MALWDKEPPKRPLNSFSVDWLLGVCPIFKSSLFPWWHPWKKFFFASGCRLEIASVSGRGACLHLFLLSRAPSHADSVSLSEFIWAWSPWLKRTGFLEVVQPLWFLDSSLPLPWVSQSPERVFDGYILFRDECSKALALCTYGCGSLCVFTSAAGGSTFDDA